MPRLIVGGFGSETVMHFPEEVCRAVQEVLARRLNLGKGMFLRGSHTSEFQPVTTVVWLSPSSPVRFEYDNDSLPDLDIELAETYWTVIESAGGIVLPSQAEVDTWRADDETGSAIESDSDADPALPR